MTVDPRTQVANLRKLYNRHLDNRLTVSGDLIEQVVVPLHDAWLKAKPPCPTCGGTARAVDPRGSAVLIVDVSHGYTYEFSNQPGCHLAEYDEMEEAIKNGDVEVSPEHQQMMLCPDCPDGVQPFDKWTAGLVALWTAVWADNVNPQNNVYAHLRQIGGTR